MLRLILCLILVPALLANQTLLCCAHTHGEGTEPSDHSQLAHVHFQGYSHDSGHDHHHDNSGDHHHHGDSDQSVPGNGVPVGQSNPTTDLDTNDLGGHDHDAIYFGQQADLHLPTSQISFAAAAVVLQWLVFESPPDLRSQHKCHQSRAGPLGPLGLYCADQCAIFLQTGCLLI